MRAAHCANPQRRPARGRIAVMLLVVAGLYVTGCIANPWTRRPSGPPTPGRVGGTPALPSPDQPTVQVPPSAPSRVWRKTVAAKKVPTRLVANDGTVCEVSEERYARVALGDLVWCIWEEANREK